ncbi:hypothetical protein [Serratia entomophila]|uniref:hypothetical protein n=1 Tax=Serratia entomophila TaxID=42906 RepID=UPI0021785C33|nr:hypothetical protein [Serratia entomophila]CAI0902148.1 Uncharacterised protein [Serratia entomophila]CAI1641128.1 Uncharacterised protein [Serratia entomophila]CAI1682150.1 Uncharacterised protein [Serratia entomophila]CAI1687836.1 Uncharacterised protein [Serratia entomophila]CAI1721660.1 Uncharacterised protein [Serratia entomophila]
MEYFHNPELYKSLVLGLIIVAVLGFVIYMLNDIDLTFKRRKYETTLKQAINSGKLKNEDTYLLATRWFVRKEKVTETLGFILSDYLNDSNCSKENLDRIRCLINWHQCNDPFSDLPDDVKLQLQKIYKMADGCQDDIIRLSKSLSEIYLSNQRKAKRERLISLFSLFVGIVGLLYVFLN